MAPETLLEDLTTLVLEGARAGFPRRTFDLSVIEGPDRGATFQIDATRPQRVLLGTSPSCELRLMDRGVSRRHAALSVEGRRLALSDLGSTNGTMVDGVAVREALLRGGEIVRIGSTAIDVTEGEPLGAVALPNASCFGGVRGGSIEMQRLYPLCARLADASVPVMIEGETGTGKECLAEALHERGPRRDGPFVVFDCTAVAPSLLESELFGHERGAFTGAVSTRAGVFERASGGTLLIDEVGDMPLALQPKLLRSIERSEVTRVGGSERIRVDVRILAATRRDLDREIQDGRFRDDLYHRLVVARLEIPPLRRRVDDIPLLVAHFCAAMGARADAVPPHMVKSWLAYAWPGNVRELRNAVARWLALGELADHDFQDPGVSMQRPRIGPPPATTAQADPIARILAMDRPLTEARQQIVDEFERRYVERAIEAAGGNVTRAAAASGVGRRYFQRLKARLDGS